MHSKLYTIHGIDEAKLAGVVEEMKKLGSPVIRVVDCGDHLRAIEGTHRIAAAAALGIVPKWDVLEQDDLVEADSLDIDGYFLAGESYPAGEVAAELDTSANGSYWIEADGTLRLSSPGWLMNA